MERPWHAEHLVRRIGNVAPDVVPVAVIESFEDIKKLNPGLGVAVNLCLFEIRDEGSGRSGWYYFTGVGLNGGCACGVGGV